MKSKTHTGCCFALMCHPTPLSSVALSPLLKGHGSTPSLPFIVHALALVPGFQPNVVMGSTGAAEVAQAQFRALDVFIVQANTNTLLSHFCSLAASLWLLARTPKLERLAAKGRS